MKRRRPVALTKAGSVLAPLGLVAEDFSRLVRIRRLVMWVRQETTPRPQVRH